jgi:hypothetical protein
MVGSQVRRGCRLLHQRVRFHDDPVSAAGSYYGEGRWTAQDALSTLRRQVGANHRTLATYLGTLRRYSLWLDQIAEPLPEPDWDQAHDADRKPVYLVVRSAKMTGD